MTRLPAWTHGRVPTFIVPAVLVGVGSYGLGRFVRYLFVLVIRRSLRGMVLVDDSNGVRTYRDTGPANSEVVCEGPVG